MEGIYYKDGIYVVIDNDTENDNCVFNYNLNLNIAGIFYGGRVKCNSYDIDNAYLSVDGIPIIKTDGMFVENHLSYNTIAMYLNAIEANGVDAFLSNYKQSVEFLYVELKELNQKTESQLSNQNDDSRIKRLLSELERIKTMIFSVLAILFSLHTYMSAGIANEKVISVCQSIMDSF